MIELNLPKVALKVTREEETLYVFDSFRKKKIVLTPEEWVRQHFAHFLVEHLNYPKSLMTIESGLRYNRRLKRTDIQVFNTAGQVEILVECKSFNVNLNQKTIEQAAIYNRQIEAKWIVITNGLKHYCFEMDMVNSTFRQSDQIPSYLIT